MNRDGFADVIVGAPTFDVVERDKGRVLLFLGSDSGLAALPAWTADGDQELANLGFAVSSAGDVNGDGSSDVVIAAPYYDAGQTDEGRAYLYTGSPSGVGTVPAWTAEGDQASARFGSSVALAGDANADGFTDLLVGAQFYTAGESREGGAFLYSGSATVPPAVAAWTAESAQFGAELGGAVTSAGDVNGDGYSDVLAGARWFDGGQVDEGAAFVFLGSPAGPSALPDASLESDQAGAHFGQSVSTAGDVNGDGYSDVLVGANDYDGGQSSEGAAFTYLGSPAGLSTTPAWMVEGDSAAAELGWSVSTAGDLDADGFLDVVVGAPGFIASQGAEGLVQVYLGSPGGLSTAPSWSLQGTQSPTYLGHSVSTAGDVNGDGYGDVIVSSLTGAPTGGGLALVFHGSATGLAPASAWTVAGNQNGAIWSVATAGDVNGDGFSDAILGLPGFNNGVITSGAALVYLGSQSGLASSPSATLLADQFPSQFGSSVSTAGDVDGDGYADVLVGAPNFDAGELDEGSAFLYLGSASGPVNDPDWTADGDQEYASFGASVASAGDANGDGFADVLVGAPRFSASLTSEGRVFLYPGNAGGGRIQAPRQTRSAGSTPIALHGRADSQSLFTIRALFPQRFAGFAWASPANEAFLEWEVKPLDEPFDGTAIVRSAVGQPIVPFAPALAFQELAERTAGRARPYKWRARIATTNPLAPNTAWFAIPGNTLTEAKLRFPRGPRAAAPAGGPAPGGTLEVP